MAVPTQSGRRGSDRSGLTLLEAVDLATTDLLTYELRRLLAFPVPLALWGDGALARAAKVGNPDAVQLYMLFVGRDPKLPEGDQQRLLWGRTRFDEGMSLLHQAAGGFGSAGSLRCEQHYAVGVYMRTLLALPLLESFKLDVIGELHRSEGHGPQTSARVAMQHGRLGVATEMMCAVLDARSTPQERAARLDALDVAPDELLAQLASRNVTGMSMRLQASLRVLRRPANALPKLR
ncbi:MAG: hypothetical protein V4669_10465 [Pseudomonadota bacterium]